MARRGHIGCIPGKRVCIVLRTGERRYGRFKHHNDRWVELEEGDPIAVKDLRSFFIIKDEHRRPKNPV